MQRTQETGSVPESVRSPGEGHGNPLQYSCLKNFTGGGAWRATVHGVTKSHTRLKRLSTRTRICEGNHEVFEMLVIMEMQIRP